MIAIPHPAQSPVSARVSVIGAGAWGTALANVLADNGHRVRLWCYAPSIATSISEQRVHHRLPGVSLNPKIEPCLDMADCYDADWVVLGLSSRQLCDYADRIDWSAIACGVGILAKGIIEPDWFISTWVGRRFSGPISVVSGPNLALEIAQRKPAASVVAATDRAHAEYVQNVLSNTYFRVYTSTDVRGVECGGIFKNVFAIAAGCLDAMGYGENAKAALVTRGLTELNRLADFFGAQPQTVGGLSGLGDLVATCFSSKSRNWQYGYQYMTAKRSNPAVRDATFAGETEGVRTIQLLYDTIRHESLDVPIISAVGRLFFDAGASPTTIIHDLMERDLKSEFDSLL